MARRILGNQPTPSTSTSVAASVQQAVEQGRSFFDELPPPDFDHTVSTGSLLLDLTISGKVMSLGGVPGGIMMEIYGPSQSGKTSVLSEMCGNAEHRGGTYDIKDPEARLVAEYARIYGVNIRANNYSRPNTVSEVFNDIFSKPAPEHRGIHIFGVDSLAALSTELEMEKGDKMGMRRAKEFSEGLRKTARIIANNGWIVACTNQVRQGDYGEITPGGNAIPYYSSLRMRIGKKEDLIRKTTIHGKERSKVVGIKSEVKVVKSSIDDPFRTCTIFIVFNYGVHDIMTNLQYLKDMRNVGQYPAVDHDYQSLEQAVAYIERNNLEQPLREQVVQMWREVEEKFHINRKQKVRF